MWGGGGGGKVVLPHWGVPTLLFIRAELIPYEQVVKELEADTIGSSAGIGHHGGRFSPGAFSQAVFINIKVGCD